MNRKIKFRGKTLETKTLFKDTIAAKGEWVYGGIVDHIGGVHILQPDSQYAFFSIRVIPETVGQFTGLYDKNGIEIYEGDIVGYTYIGEDGEEKEYVPKKGVVNFKNNGWHINSKFLDGFTMRMFTFEVIGNIYESEVTNEQKMNMAK